MRVQLPDGKVAEFPDDMSQEAIADVIKQSYLSPSREMSAITAKPVPTFGEKAAAGSTIARQGLPILGDVLFSIAAKRPLSVFTAGRKMGGLMQAGGQAVAAGAGSGAGEFAAQKAFGEDTDFDAVQNQITYGAATDLGFSTLTKIAGTTLKYLKNNTSGGQRAAKQIASKIREKTTERAEKFVNDLAPESVKGQTNVLDDINLKMKQAELETHAEYDVYRNAMQQHFDKVGEIDLQHTFDFIENLRNDIAEKNVTGRAIKEGAFTDTPKFGENRVRKDVFLKKSLFPGIGMQAKQNRILDELLTSSRSGDPVSPDTINDLLSNVFKKGKGSIWENLTSIEKKRLEAFKEAIKKDLDYIPVESGGTVKTAKEAADENFKAVKRYNAVLGIWNKSIQEDSIGNIVFKPKKFAREVFMNERKFMNDPVLKELWPQLKAEAEEYAMVSKTLTSKEMRPDVGGNWMDVIPVSSLFGKMSAYAMLDPASQKAIQGIIKYGSIPTEIAAKAGSKVLGSELGFTSREDRNL